MISPEILNAAGDLLARRDRHTTEGNVQSDIEALLRSMQVGSIESHYRIGGGEADIYLPNRRAFIECKAYPNASQPEKRQGRKVPESPREQLDRYVRAEIDNELTQLPGIATNTDVPWVGIVTDGTHWHLYRYPNKAQAVGVLENSKTILNEADVLADFLSHTLGSTMVGKAWIPQNPGGLFSDLKNDLVKIYAELPPRAATHTDTKRRLWLDIMRTSGMVPSKDVEQERLFLAHSFLIVIARMVSHTLKGDRSGEEWQTALKDGFASWVLDFERGRSWAKKVWGLVDRYDWRKRRSDVLRDLYHTYVDADDRKVFGEFYTPDWLAALMVEQVLDDAWLSRAVQAARTQKTEGIGVLDPTCGSGTFLYHAALRLLDFSEVNALRPVERANIVTSLVNGMDIHPVAVEIARVNIERALPAEPADGESAYKIFLGDSLQSETRGELLFGHTEDSMQLTTPKGNSVHIPMDLVVDPSFAEKLRQMVNAAAEEKPLPAHIVRGDDHCAAFESCHKALTEIIKEEGNSVWTWYAVNLAGPYMLSKRKIDRLIGNPPWVKLADIQVEQRKRTMEDFGVKLGIQEGGNMAPHLDIASYFILRSRSLYAANPKQNPGAWLVKKSAIRSGQWDLFRKRHTNTLAQSADLESLKVFGGGDATRCCILMEHRPLTEISSPRIFAELTGKTRPSPLDPFRLARGRFRWTVAPRQLPQAPSDYNNDSVKIMEGATIVPHVLSYVTEHVNSPIPGWTQIVTRKSQKKAWKELPSQTGLIPTKWIRQVHTSPDMLPYMAIRKPPSAIIPIDSTGKIHADPGRDCDFWEELDEIYDKYKGRGRSTPKTLIAQFNYRKKLSEQPLMPSSERSMVLLPGSGDIMRAARHQPGAAIVDSTLFWLTVRNEDEAGYLVTLLNAKCLRRAFADSRESGRHFQLHPWRKVPIPRYDYAIRAHRRLAKLCERAEEVVVETVANKLQENSKLGQRGLSTVIRQAVERSKVGREIEMLAAQILPEQAA